MSIRLSDAERAALTARAGARPLGTYMKECLFANSPVRPSRAGLSLADKALLAQLLATLGGSRLAPNLEELARLAEAGSLFVDEETTRRLRIACDDVRLMHNALMRGLGKKGREQSHSEHVAKSQFNAAANAGAVE